MHRFRWLVVFGSLATLAGCGSPTTKPQSIAHADAPLELSQCMRSHGVPNFPDPGPRGGINLDTASGIDPASPAFQAAQAACKAYVPNEDSIPAMSASERALAFVFAKCMRIHGQPDFPDPTIGAPSTSTTGRILALRGMFFAVGPNFNPATPAFRHAATACGVTLPGASSRPVALSR